MDYFEMGKFYEKLAKKSRSTLKKDYKKAGYWYSSAADYYQIHGDEQKFIELKELALKCFSNYLEESRKKQMEDGNGQVYLWISHIYQSLGNPDKFQNYLIKAAEVFTLNARNLAKNYRTTLQAIINYYNSANCYRLLGENKKAWESYGKALNIYNKKGKNEVIGFSPVLRATCYYRMGEQNKAIEILEGELTKEHLSPLVFSNTHLILGCYYLDKRSEKNAENHFQAAKIVPDTEKISAPELITQALCQLMLKNSEGAIGLAELSVKISSKLRDYNLRQLIQEIRGLVINLARGQYSVAEKIMASLSWRHFDLPLFDALSIIKKNQIKNR
ncbi:MAG: tetratricopeptide repeat protein [Candidatus Jordarchaeum sp.]|uniref:tetratricopeptide repeat protein n=1 Tax=Candidatus Jordarchaeum sp. TaxID=2823881 RepID=UPI00404AD4EA